MKWSVELIHDEAGFFRYTRVGNWTHILDYETGQGEWRHYCETESTPLSEQKMERICTKHFGGIVHYDEPRCPACVVEEEFLTLTKAM